MLKNERIIGQNSIDIEFNTLHGSHGELQSDRHAKTVEYIKGLNGLRAFAVLAVVGVHAQWPMMTGGSIGVDLFFVISGYLITKILMNEQLSLNSINLTRFYSRRFVRLFPPLIIVILCFSLYAIAVGSNDLVLTNAIAGITYVADYTRSRFNQPNVLAHLWSISIEEKFYLIWAPLLAITAIVSRKIPILFIIGFLILTVVVWRAYRFINGANLVGLYDGFDTRADAILMGAALAIIPSEARKRLARLWPMAVALMVAWLAFGTWSVPLLYFGGFTFMAFVAAVIVAAVEQKQRSPGVNFLEVSVISYIGRISYGIYLWHMPMLYIFDSSIKLGPQKSMLMALPLSILFAALSYRFVERPLLDRRSALSPFSGVVLAAAGPVLVLIGIAYALALRAGMVAL